ncbi:hypothetical protein BX070DRAFT_225493 [Coemansia spiralis]|nr:hypothetical protein BX070DRAFT_225493 [Coemansia spiralis]
MPKVKKTQVTQYSSDDDSSEDSGQEFSQLEDSDIDENGSIIFGQQDGDDYSEDSSINEPKSKIDLMREKLADMPFNQLIRIQQQMGAKNFNRAMGLEEKQQRKKSVISALKQKFKEPVDDSDESSDEDSSDSSVSEPQLSAHPKRSSDRNAMKSDDYYRNSKKMPTVMSSKRPVSRFRQVVDIQKTKTRDPRFDSLSGNFNEDLYDKTYGFLEKQQQEEMDMLKRQALKLKHTNPEEASRIQSAVSSLKSQLASKEQKRKTQELKRKHRKTELDAVKQGKKPYFLKKRELKDLEVAEKYSKLKDSSKLDGYLEKRRKRNAAKDHRRMPYQRRQE